MLKATKTINLLNLFILKMARTKRPPRKSVKRTRKFNRGAPVGLRSNGLRRYTQRLGAPDKKYLDKVFAAATVPAAGGVTDCLLLGLIAGNTDNSRVGNHLTMTNISIHGEVYVESDAGFVVSDATAFDDVRIIVVYDKQSNGTAPAITDVLNTADINSFRNMNQLDRFIVLKDKRMSLHTNLTFEGSTSVRNAIMPSIFKFNKKVALPVDFADATTATIANIKTGGLFVMAISRNGLAATHLTTRVKFLDNYPYN